MENKTEGRLLKHRETKKKHRKGLGSMNSIYLISGILLAVICFLYGMVVLSAGSGTGFFVVWFLMGGGFAGLGVFLHLGLWTKMPGLLQRAILILAAAGILLFVVVEGMIISQMSQKGKNGLDYILVLGAQVNKDGPSRSLKYRLDKAAEYMEGNPDTLCVVSGGQGFNEPFSEAEGMADYLLEKGIPKEKLILEAESKTTAENITNSRKLMRESASVGIITNDFHMFRALQIARSKGTKNICGISAASTKSFLPNNMLREFFAEIKYLIKKTM